MKIGDKIVTKSRVISRTDTELFAIATGAVEPMFLSEEGAKAAGWKNQLVPGLLSYSIAVGLRIDEMDRVRKDYKDNNVFYPLMDYKISKKERNKIWNNEPIKITIPAYKGNCDLCFEKSNRKLMTIIKEEPDKAIWWDSMIKKYSHIEKENSPSYNDLLKENNGMTFYRGYKTIEDLVKMAQQPFSKATDEYIYENDLFDLEDECGSGCKVF